MTHRVAAQGHTTLAWEGLKTLEKTFKRDSVGAETHEQTHVELQ